MTVRKSEIGCVGAGRVREDAAEQIDFIGGVMHYDRDAVARDRVRAVVDVPEVVVLILVELQGISNTVGEDRSVAREVVAARRHGR